MHKILSPQKKQGSALKRSEIQLLLMVEVQGLGFTGTEQGRGRVAHVKGLE